MKKALVLCLACVFAIALVGCSCSSTSGSSSDTSSNTATNSAHSDNSANEKTSPDTGSQNNSKDVSSSSKKYSTGGSFQEIKTYDDLLNAAEGTRVTIEGVALNNAFDRAWKGTHYKFDMTFGDSDGVVSIDMNYKLKSKDIKKGTKVSVSGRVDGTTYSSLRGTKGPDNQVPELVIDSYRVLS